MTRRFFAMFAMLLALATLPAQACGPYGMLGMTWNGALTSLSGKDAPADSYKLIMDLRSTDAAVREQAVATLQPYGAWALRAAFESHVFEIERAKRDPSWNPPQWQALSASLDQLAHQKNAYASGLYWYTDLTAARAAAREARLPILSLRLLGQLDQELTCANSRFFRTVLYPDPDVADYLRANYVLHWESVREVPTITIDLGQGRQIRQTITGNSMHLMLDADGRVLDVLPGVYTPARFHQALVAVHDFHAQQAELPATQVTANIQARHRSEIIRLQKSWGAELEAAGVTLDEQTKSQLRRLDPNRPATAEAASALTASKAMVEVPMFRALGVETGNLERQMNDETWTRVGTLHGLPSFSAASQSLMRRQFASMPEVAPDQIEAQIEGLRRSVAIESARNAYSLREAILQRLAQNLTPFALLQPSNPPGVDPRSAATATLVALAPNATPAAAPVVTARPDDSVEKRLTAFTARIYAEVFRTPLDDPWMGLDRPDVYTAIAGGGREILSAN